MSGARAAPRMGAAMLAVMLCGCPRQREQPWLGDNGERLGTIVSEPRDDGSSRKRYLDVAGRLVRMEFFRPDGQPSTPVAATMLRYQGDQLSAREYYDAHAALTNGEDGYAVTRFRSDGDAAKGCTFFDREGAAVSRPDGTQQIDVTMAGKQLTRAEYRDAAGLLLRTRVYTYRGERLKEIRYVGPDTRPTSGRFRDLTVATVRYDYIKGVHDRPIVAEHYLAPTGESLRTLFYPQPPSYHWCE